MLNPSIARCNLPKIYDWGTKTVYFQPQTGGANDEKAFVGYIYFGKLFLDKNYEIFSASDIRSNAIRYR